MTKCKCNVDSSLILDALGIYCKVVGHLTLKSIQNTSLLSRCARSYTVWNRFGVRNRYEGLNYIKFVEICFERGKMSSEEGFFSPDDDSHLGGPT